ncbi:LysR family transcriptional regulator [Enemella evansiae]|uniref:LysR family transcriptional regulator n=1 Tax=Enemella evansiae TaxID=2016499 RepID=A0A255G0J0_9ACTN|nr:LysR family transcriptional regulator [Enemella evansiae]OYN98116.1 LysR family transcriptional regulator [Enemella evansiae]OYO09457.1 LysR family transcriptional regulator [Enemella evansiae]OYO15309.1 LysR family transcriptional regulator [Enemella evansiae]OYO20374.1 LysR family transcriptional regulator [Enemella evansiae]
MSKPSLPDLAAVELLIAVVDQGSLGAGARAVGMAQPNASRILRRLEARAGVPLLERRPRGSRATPAGLELAAEGRLLLARVDDFSRTLAGLVDAESLTVAASQTIAESLAGGWLAELYADHPAIEVGLQVCNSDQVTARVLRGQVRLGFIESGRVDDRLQSSIVAADRLVVLVAPEHPWAQRERPLEADELAATSLAVRESGSGTREVLERQLAGRTVARPAIELTSNAALLGAVAADLAPAVLSELAAAAPLAAGTVVSVPVRGLDLTRRLHAIWATRLQGIAHDLVRIAAATGTPHPRRRADSPGAR